MGWESSNRAIGWTTRLQVQVALFLEAARASRAERGATAIEYSLMGSLIAMTIIIAVLAMSGKVTGLFQTVADTL